MSGQENCARVTRASKKRAFAAGKDQPLQQLPVVKKKQVVLGDITNSEDIGLIRKSGFGGGAQKPKSELKQTKKDEQEEEGEVEESVNTEVDEGSDDGGKKCSYAPLIYQYLHSLEVEEKRRPVPGYMEKVQKDVTVEMREILVDWLVEVAEEYKLVSDTLYLTVSYIDRFLSSHSLSRNKLQLLGVCSILVASKYEEISPPHVEDFCYITDNTYGKEEVVGLERDLLKFLNFEISNPTTKTFLRIFTKAVEEISMMPNFQVLRFTIQPKKHPLSTSLQQYSGYAPSELKECVLTIHELQLSRRGDSLRAVREKYSQHKFKCVATLSSPSDIPAWNFDAIDG